MTLPWHELFTSSLFMVALTEIRLPLPLLLSFVPVSPLSPSACRATTPQRHPPRFSVARNLKPALELQTKTQTQIGNLLIRSA